MKMYERNIIGKSLHLCLYSCTIVGVIVKKYVEILNGTFVNRFQAVFVNHFK
jgi:hypothetical protein